MKARFETQCGSFDVRLDTSSAPVTAGYFIELIQKGAFDETSFFRIVGPDNAAFRAAHPIHVIQGGLREKDVQPVPPVSHETTEESGLSHRQWTLSAARYDPGETYGSFFICMRDEPALDFGGGRHPDGQGFAAFGEVVSGFDTVQAIFDRREKAEYLENPVQIHSCRMIDA